MFRRQGGENCFSNGGKMDFLNPKKGKTGLYLRENSNFLKGGQNYSRPVPELSDGGGWG